MLKNRQNNLKRVPSRESYCPLLVAKAQFKRRTFRVPNLFPSIKYVKRSTFESVKSEISNLGRPMN